jgi:hypothetical protein
MLRGKRRLRTAMTMYFSAAIDRYFAAWILPDTWDAAHDMYKFYLFVYAVHFYSKRVNRNLDRARRRGDRNPRTFDESAMRTKIKRAIDRNHPRFDKARAVKIAEERAKAAMQILECLAAVQEWFPCIESTWQPHLR